MKRQSQEYRRACIDAMLFGGPAPKTDEELIAEQVVKQAEKISPQTVVWGAERRRVEGAVEWVVMTPFGPKTLRQLEREARAAA